MNLHTSHNARLAGVVTALLLGLTARPVSAQAVPEVTQHTEDVVAEIPAEVEDETTWNIAAGANISTGNTRARNFNAGTDFYVLRDIHALSFRTAFVFGQADVDGGGPGNYEINSRNLNSRLRYDIFLTANDALFIAVALQGVDCAGAQMLHDKIVEATYNENKARAFWRSKETLKNLNHTEVYRLK